MLSDKRKKKTASSLKGRIKVASSVSPSTTSRKECESERVGFSSDVLKS